MADRKVYVEVTTGLILRINQEQSISDVINDMNYSLGSKRLEIRT
jgi:hypothetical protein